MSQFAQRLIAVAFISLLWFWIGYKNGKRIADGWWQKQPTKVEYQTEYERDYDAVLRGWDLEGDCRIILLDGKVRVLAAQNNFYGVNEGAGACKLVARASNKSGVSVIQ